MKKIQLSITVEIPDNMTPEWARKLVQGQMMPSDLRKVVENSFYIQIGDPQLASTPRCLVVVSGGVASYMADNGVSVEVFDWDNYNTHPESTGGVPEEFADLAKLCNVPVEGEE